MSKKSVKMTIEVPIAEHKKLKRLARDKEETLKDFMLNLIFQTLYKDKKPNAVTRRAMRESAKGKTTKGFLF